MEGMNQTGVPCNHICKCHNETLVQLLYTNKSVLKKNTECAVLFWAMLCIKMQR
jgi:hypothetical protein